MNKGGDSVMGNNFRLFHIILLAFYSTQITYSEEAELGTERRKEITQHHRVVNAIDWVKDTPLVIRYVVDYAKLGLLSTRGENGQ